MATPTSMHWSDSPWSVGWLLGVVAVISSASTLVFLGELLLARRLIMAAAGLSMMGGSIARLYRHEQAKPHNSRETEIPVRSAAQLAGQTAQAVAVQVDDTDSDSERERESADDPE